MVPKVVLAGLLIAGAGVPAHRAHAQAPPATTANRRPVQYAVLYAQPTNANRPAGDARLELQYGLAAGYTADETSRLREEAAKVKGFSSAADALDYLGAHGWEYVDTQTDVVRDVYWQRYTLRRPLN